MGMGAGGQDFIRTHLAAGEGELCPGTSVNAVVCFYGVEYHPHVILGETYCENCSPCFT